MLTTIHNAKNDHHFYSVTQGQLNFLNHNEDIFYDPVGQKWLFDMDLNYIQMCLFNDHERNIPVYSYDGDGDIDVNYDELVELVKNKVCFIDSRRDYVYYTEKTRDTLHEYIGGSYRHDYICDWYDEAEKEKALSEWRK